MSAPKLSEIRARHATDQCFFPSTAGNMSAIAHDHANTDRAALLALLEEVRPLLQLMGAYDDHNRIDPYCIDCGESFGCSVDCRRSRLLRRLEE